MAVRGHRVAQALGLSLAVHGAVGLWSAREPTSTPPRAFELTDLVWVTPAPTPAPAVAPAAPQRVRQRPTVRGTPQRRAMEPAPSPAPSPLPPSPEVPALESDVPRRVDLAPVGPSWGLPAGNVEVARGRTVTPGQGPSDAELQAEAQARVEARVGGWLRQDLAVARVRGGLPDPEYGLLGAALRESTREVPAFIDTSSAREVATAFKESWLAGAQRYGRTGAAWSPAEGDREALERPSALVDAAAHGVPDAAALMGFLSAGARLQEFADGRAGLELFALVEVRQAPSGAPEGVTLVRPSGLQPFDAWVLERASTVTAQLGLDAGTRTRPLRSVWRFDGVLKFRRTLKPGTFDGRAALGMITMNALSALANLNWAEVINPHAGPTDPNWLRAPRMPLAGRFDELSGELDVVDFTNPHYDCRVTLIEAE